MIGRVMRQRHLAVLLVCTLVGAGCVGVTDREDFDALVDSRGGGVSSDLGLDAINAVAERIGVDDIELTTMSINPGGRTAVITIRVPDQRQNLDRWVYRARGGLIGPEPVRVSARDDLDAESFWASDVPALARTEELADASFDALELEGGSVESIVVTMVQGQPNILLGVDSPRAGGNARFTATGELIEAARS